MASPTHPIPEAYYTTPLDQSQVSREVLLKAAFCLSIKSASFFSMAKSGKLHLQIELTVRNPSGLCRKGGFVEDIIKGI